MPADPTTLVDTAHKLVDLFKYLAPAFVVVVVWVWKASKDHSKIGILRKDHEDLEGRVDSIDEKLDQFITVEQHTLMQQQCQDHIAREQGEKMHAAIMAMKRDNEIIREDMSVMNANICKLLGRFDVEPVMGKEKKRRTDGISGAVL